VARAAVIAAVVCCALVVRFAFVDFRSGDYQAFVSQWYAFIAQHGGFAALRYDFANYNVPYLYLLALLTYTPLPALYAVKLISVAFDLLLAFFAYRIVALHRPGTWWPVVAGAVVLFLPTVELNSAVWAQADAIYSAFSLGAVYFVLRRRPWLACVFFGLALSFKLQAVFLFPVLVLLVARRRIPWPALLLVPAVYLLMDVPALLVGADPRSLLSVYVTETGTYDQLTLNAPNVYQFLGDVGPTTMVKALGIELTGLLLLALVVPVMVRRIELTPTRIVLATAVCSVLVPFFLPAMHERYFYLADALTVVAAFYLPRRLWALPVLEQFASAFAYAPFLLATGGNGRGGGFGAGGLAMDTLVSFPILASVMLAALVLVAWTAIQDFRGVTAKRAGPARSHW
jgi:Gpi18-like mannosyltransferase